MYIKNSTDFNDSLLKSFKTIDGPLHTIESLIDKFMVSNSEKSFNIRQIGISNLKSWDFDAKNNFVHESGKFFKLVGLNYKKNKSGLLLQDEIGTLGVLCCNVEGVTHFLIQLKKEPGNSVQSQLSPTLQATLSNQNRKHGGSSPQFLEEFNNINQKKVISEKKLPEQGGIYWQKFNNNIILETSYFKEPQNFLWMTLGQIYKFSDFDNSINSCLRSVLSLLNIEKKSKINSKFQNKINLIKNEIISDCNLENSVKEFLDKDQDKFYFQHSSTKFQVSGLDVEIVGREVSKWNQPIILQENLLEYIFLRVKYKNKNYFVLNIDEKPGYKNNFVFGPIIITNNNKNEIESGHLFSNNDTKLIKEFEMSEEGGRFLNLQIKHSFYENLNMDDIKLSKNQFLFSYSEILKLNELSLLSMEGRSMLFFSNSIYNLLN